MTVSINKISNLPEPPSTDDPENFSLRADQFFSSLPSFVVQTNNSIDLINQAVLEASGSASNSRQSELAAAAASNALAFDSSTVYEEGQVVYSAIDFQTYRRTGVDPGTTGADPQTDTSQKWIKLTGTGTIDGASIQSMSNKTLINPSMIGQKERYQNLTSNNLVTLDTSKFSVFSLNVGSALTIELIAPHLGTGEVATCILEIKNSGQFLVVWNSNIKWSYGIPPNLSSAGTDIISFYSYDKGATWKANVVSVGVI